jgi:hypothetical protein
MSKLTLIRREEQVRYFTESLNKESLEIPLQMILIPAGDGSIPILPIDQK